VSEFLVNDEGTLAALFSKPPEGYPDERTYVIVDLTTGQPITPPSKKLDITKVELKFGDFGDAKFKLFAKPHGTNILASPNGFYGIRDSYTLVQTSAGTYDPTVIDVIEMHGRRALFQITMDGAARDRRPADYSFSGDSRFAVAWDANIVQVYDIANRARTFTKSIPMDKDLNWGIGTAKLSTTGKFLCLRGNKGIDLYNLANNQEFIFRYPNAADQQTTKKASTDFRIDFTDDEKFLVISPTLYSDDDQKQILIYDLNAEKVQWASNDQYEANSRVKMIAGNLINISLEDRFYGKKNMSSGLFDLKSLKLLGRGDGTPSQHAFGPVVFSPNGKHMIEIREEKRPETTQLSLSVYHIF